MPDTLLYRAHRPDWMKDLRWAKLYYCARCERRFIRLGWNDGL
jgi:hypothetical protein